MASEGIIYHFNAVRLRLSGTGSLQMTLINGTKNFSLVNTTIPATSERETLTKANFRQQYVQLEIKTMTKDEKFKISKITIYLRQSASGYPG